VRGTCVGARSAALGEAYAYGLKRFRSEAQMLTRFNHINIVKVWRLLDFNDTAYIVMSFEEGETLAVLLERYRGGLPEQKIFSLFDGIASGLELVHRTGHLHRDLAPDNIIVRHDEVPVIVDFGAARCSYGRKSRSLEAVIKCGYSPPEQYIVEDKREGPWTDLYALGAIAYRCIGGPTPPASLDRQTAVLNGRADPLVSPAIVGRGRYSPGLLNAIGVALMLPPNQRPASVSAWYATFPRPRTAPRMEPGKTKVPQDVHSGFLRKLFRFGRRGTSSRNTRCWILVGTDSAGKSILLEIRESAFRRSQGKIVIGRDRTQSDITILDHSVSRRHALLSLRAGGLLIEDANSRNGTWVNGMKLTPSKSQAPLSASTLITLGRVRLVLQDSKSHQADA
jgi:serine/threonine protein kinase